MVGPVGCWHIELKSGNMEAEELGPFQDIFLEEKISSRLRKLIKCQVLKVCT